jgi:hypothetical protein
MDFSDFGSWLAGAVAVVGLIQWIKGLVPKTTPTWVYAVLAPVLALGWALAPEPVQQASGVLGVSQIGYETIIQTVKKRLGGATEGNA